MRRFNVLVILAACCGGCVTHSGPFVTNISNAGNGNLTIEKCYSDFDAAMSSGSTGSCTTQTLHIDSAKAP